MKKQNRFTKDKRRVESSLMLTMESTLSAFVGLYETTYGRKETQKIVAPLTEAILTHFNNRSKKNKLLCK